MAPQGMQPAQPQQQQQPNQQQRMVRPVLANNPGLRHLLQQVCHMIMLVKLKILLCNWA